MDIVDNRTRTLRPDQQLALDNLRESVGLGERRIVLQAPCGYGKTVLAAASRLGTRP